MLTRNWAPRPRPEPTWPSRPRPGPRTTILSWKNKNQGWKAKDNILVSSIFYRINLLVIIILVSERYVHAWSRRRPSSGRLLTPSCDGSLPMTSVHSHCGLTTISSRSSLVTLTTYTSSSSSNILHHQHNWALEALLLTDWLTDWLKRTYLLTYLIYPLCLLQILTRKITGCYQGRFPPSLHHILSYFVPGGLEF